MLGVFLSKKVFWELWPIRVKYLVFDPLGYMPHPMGPTNQGPVKIKSPFDLFKAQRFGTPLSLKTRWVAHIYARTIHTSSSAYQQMDDHADEWMIIQTIEYTRFHKLFMCFPHMSLHGNYLHTTPKDHTTRSYIPWMGREALRSWSLNSKIFSTKKAPTFKRFWLALHHYISQNSSSLRYVKIPNFHTIEFLEIFLSLT